MDRDRMMVQGMNARPSSHLSINPTQSACINILLDSVCSVAEIEPFSLDRWVTADMRYAFGGLALGR